MAQTNPYDTLKDKKIIAKLDHAWWELSLTENKLVITIKEKNSVILNFSEIYDIQ